MDLLDGVDPEALRARAVNTIAKEGSRLVGSNTDVAAIRAAVGDLGVEPRGADVLILGAGVSARAAAVALAGAHVTFVARRPNDVDVPGRVVPCSPDDCLRHTRSSDLLLNAARLARRDD